MGRGAQPAVVASPVPVILIKAAQDVDKRAESSYPVLRKEHLRETNKLKLKLTKIKRLVNLLEGVHSLGQFMAVFQELKVLVHAKSWYLVDYWPVVTHVLIMYRF